MNKELICKMYEEGFSMRRIALEFNTNHKLISRILKKEDIKTRKPNNLRGVKKFECPCKGCEARTVGCLERRRKMITQETIDKKIERLQEEMVLAEKCMDELSKKKDEIQEVIELLKNEKMKQDKRLQAGETYGYVDDLGQICSKIESGLLPDEYRYEIGNYYLTSEDAIRAEKQIRLFRLLDRFSRENGWTDELWKNSIIEKYYIYFDYNYKSIKTESVYISRYVCQVYFVSESVAQQAIKKYHDLIIEVMAI